MSGPKVLIITNGDFKYLEDLEGYKTDHQNLQDMWKKFGCEVKAVTSLTAKQILQEVEDFQEKITGSETFVAVFILSHGGKDDTVFGVNHTEKGPPTDYVYASDILSNFHDTQKLKEVPKILIFQTCRGGDYDRLNIGDEVDGGSKGRIGCSQKLSGISNALVAFPCQPGLVSFVHSQQGSWFIQDIIAVFSSTDEKKHVVDMMAEVNYKLAQRHHSHAKCMSVFTSSITEKVYINQYVHDGAQNVSKIKEQTIGENVIKAASSTAKEIPSQKFQREADPTNRTRLYRSRQGSPKVLVICNSANEGREEFGYDVDRDAVERMWEDMGCEVIVKENLTGDEMEEEIRKFACNKGMAECLSGDERFAAVFVISFSKKKDVIYGTDGKPAKVVSLLEHFKNKNVHLQEMPKLFFLQTDMLTQVAGEGKGQKLAPWDKSIPEVSDLFFVSASRVCLSDDGRGVFVKILAQEFARANEDHLADLMISVQKNTKNIAEKNDCSFVSEFSSTLRDVFFLADSGQQ